MPKGHGPFQWIHQPAQGNINSSRSGGSGSKRSSSNKREFLLLISRASASVLSLFLLLLVADCCLLPAVESPASVGAHQLRVLTSAFHFYLCNSGVRKKEGSTAVSLLSASAVAAAGKSRTFAAEDPTAASGRAAAVAGLPCSSPTALAGTLMPSKAPAPPQQQQQQPRALPRRSLPPLFPSSTNFISTPGEKSTRLAGPATPLLLSLVNVPRDLRALKPSQLPQLCK